MSAQKFIERVASIPTNRNTLRRDQFEGDAHAGGSGETTILEYATDQPISLRNGARYRLVPVVRESFTTDGSSGDTDETINLSNNLIDSDVSDDVVAYVDGTRTSVNATDYAANSIDIDDQATTDSAGTVYYVAAEQAQVKIKKVGPGGSVSETLVEHDAALINQRDPNRDPLRFSLDASPWQATIPSNWKLQVTVNGPVNAGWDPDTDPTPANLLVSMPIERSTVSEVDGLGSVVRTDTSQRV